MTEAVREEFRRLYNEWADWDQQEDETEPRLLQFVINHFAELEQGLMAIQEKTVHKLTENWWYALNRIEMLRNDIQRMIDMAKHRRLEPEQHDIAAELRQLLRELQQSAEDALDMDTHYVQRYVGEPDMLQMVKQTMLDALAYISVTDFTYFNTGERNAMQEKLMATLKKMDALE